MRFLKVHGAGNDFVLLPDPDGTLTLTPALARALCAAHTGLGADGVIRLATPQPEAEADVFMDYRNADGSLAEMCGNGVRCVAKYIADRDPQDRDVVRVETRAGVKIVEVVAGQEGRAVAARVDMGRPEVGKVDWPLQVDGREIRFTTVSMGNPHAVVNDEADTPALEWLGPRLQRHPAFPEGTNVEVVAVAGPDRVRGRIWERGVGETLSSGTGASAIAVAAHLLGHVGRRVTVALPGGDLFVEWTEESLWVTGPAVEVASGTLDPDWLAAQS